MKQLLTILTLLLVAAAWMAAPVTAKEAQYVGVKNCGKCHKKDKARRQLPIWQKSEHSEAFAVLGSDKAKKAAQKVGVSGNPQKAAACLVCHTTGFGEDSSRFRKKFKMSDGVQCEACHGAGSLYKKKKVMKKIRKELGADKKGDSPTAKKTGFLVANEQTCKRCHAQSITFKGKEYKNPNYEEFDFKEHFEEIKHSVP